MSARAQPGKLPCPALRRRLPQPREHLPKALKPSLQILDDLFGEFVRFGQVFQIDQALVLEPEEVEAGLVAGRQFLVAVAPPAALGRIRWP